MRNSRVRELYEDFMAETDEQAAEMIYSAYLRALRDGDEKTNHAIERLQSALLFETDDDPEQPVEDDDDFEHLPIGIEVA